MINTKQKEVWKVYPKYPFIEASNLGRVRTKDRYVSNGKSKRLVKGRVLKQQLSKGGYLLVYFRVDGKLVGLLVHRIVATCFLPNPNNLPEVNHKDNDRTNNVVSNLEWCTRQHNEAYKKNFGTSQAEVLGKPVITVNLRTGKVLRFESQHEASRQLGVSHKSINDVVKGRRRQAGGYWFTENESEITEEKIKEIRNHMYFLGGVIGINLEALEVFYFESQHEAARKFGISSSSITAVLKGRLNKTHGYWFCYADEHTMKKTSEKFGDEIANRVEELMSKSHN